MMTGTDIGKKALANKALLKDVREHNLIAFRQAWKKLDEAVPGTMRLYPQNEIVPFLKSDYEHMRDLLFSMSPEFSWVLEQVQIAEDIINRR